VRKFLVLAILLAAVAWWLQRAPEPTHHRIVQPQPRVSEPEPAPPEAEPVPVQPAEAVPVPRLPPRQPQDGDVAVTLSEAPAPRYLGEAASDTAEHYCSLVQQIARANDQAGAVVCDASLSRAAREYVFQFTEFGELVPSDVGQFLVSGSGAVTSDVQFQQVRTTSEGEASLRTAIQAIVQDPGRKSGVLHVGVGEVWQTGAELPRHIGVLGTRLGMQLDPLETTAPLESTWTVTGRLLRAWRGLHALVMGPDGALRELPVTVTGDAVELAVPTGPHRGSVDVQILGEGPDGPGKLVQLRVWVGQKPPRTHYFAKPLSERHIDTAAEAEQHMFLLVNADRKRHGLPILTWDPALRDIAAAHSADMRDRDYFAHRTPSGSMPADRLQAAGYKAATYAENIALDDAVHQAQAGLMASLGHRRNLLDPKVTHVGIGVSGESLRDGRYRWWLTQLFAKPSQQLDPVRDAAAVLARLDQARTDAGLPALIADSGLSACALVGAEAGVTSFQGASRRALDEVKARDLLNAPLRAWAIQTTDLAALELPAVALDRMAQRVGLGLAQRPDDPSGQLVLVLLFAMQDEP